MKLFSFLLITTTCICCGFVVQANTFISSDTTVAHVWENKNNPEDASICFNASGVDPVWNLTILPKR